MKISTDTQLALQRFPNTALVHARHRSQLVFVRAGGGNWPDVFREVC